MVGFRRAVRLSRAHRLRAVTLSPELSGTHRNNRTRGRSAARCDVGSRRRVEAPLVAGVGQDGDAGIASVALTRAPAYRVAVARSRENGSGSGPLTTLTRSEVLAARGMTLAPAPGSDGRRCTCGSPIEGQAAYCSDACRSRAYRAAHAGTNGSRRNGSKKPDRRSRAPAEHGDRAAAGTPTPADHPDELAWLAALPAAVMAVELAGGWTITRARPTPDHLALNSASPEKERIT